MRMNQQEIDRLIVFVQGTLSCNNCANADESEEYLRIRCVLMGFTVPSCFGCIHWVKKDGDGKE